MKITIVTCVYNGSKFGERYLSGILNIIDLLHEVIIVDDGSTDYPEEYLSELCRLEKVTFLSKPNSGLPDSRNFGVRYTTSDYVILLDIDDTISRNGLSKAIQQQKFDADIIRCYCWYEREHTYLDTFLFLKSYLKLFFDPVGPLLKSKIYYNNYITTPGSLIFKREVLQNEEFNVFLSIGEDWEYFVRSFNKFHLISVKVFLVNYLVVSNSMSETQANNQKKLQSLCEALSESFACNYPFGNINKYRLGLSLHFKMASIQRHSKNLTFSKIIKSYLRLFQTNRNNYKKILISFITSLARKVI